MDRKLTLRLVFSVVMILAAWLAGTGCRSADSGLMGVSNLVDPVPPQWEPEVETLSHLNSFSENEETNPAE